MDERFLVFLDIDGTLAKHEKVIKENIDAIRKVREKGHLVFINTGRGYQNIPEYIRNADYIDGFVAGIGAHIVIKEETIFSNPMDKDLINGVVNAFLGSKHYVFFEGEDSLIQIGTVPLNNIKLCITEKDGYTGELLKHKISKFTIMNQGEYTKEQKEALNAVRLIDMNRYCEGTMKENSKGEGLKRVAEYYNIPIERTIAMGDSKNDIEMLKSAGTAVVMGDGQIEAKQYADFVSVSCQQGGVKHALEKLLLK